MMNQVEEDESSVPALEDEAIEVECLLMEPKDDNFSVDGVFCFNGKNLEKCMETEDVSFSFGGSDSVTTQEGEDELKLEVLDVMPFEADLGNLQAGNGLSSTCEDYLLDIEFAESITNLDYDSSKGWHLGNSDSESQIPGFSTGDSGTLGITDLSAAIISVPECQNDLLDKTICELHGISSCKCGCETSVEDKWLKCPPPFHSQNVDKWEDVSNFLVRGISSDVNDKYMIFPPGLIPGEMSCPSTFLQNNEVSLVGQSGERQHLHGQDVLTKNAAQASDSGAILPQKRLRKPTQRYIDELADLNSRYCKRRQEVSTFTIKDKFLGVRCHKPRHMESRAMTLSHEESFGEVIQVPFDSRVQKECWKKHASIMVLNSDEEPSPAELEDVTTVRSEEGGGPRKHHKPWTLSEVRKLIDGVSQYGVGRWTYIKRLLFSSSAHRTSVDLKDKWRNLLKASCVQRQNKREDKQKRNHPWRPLPKSVLRRVSELATIYPYPRDCKSKLSGVHHVSSPTLAARNTGVSFSLNGRIVQRKNYT